jgi:hypothetical protein
LTKLIEIGPVVWALLFMDGHEEMKRSCYNFFKPIKVGQVPVVAKAGLPAP